jgi:uncharacterized protein YkwD
MSRIVSLATCWGGVVLFALTGMPGCAGRTQLPAQDSTTRRIEIEVLRLTNAYRQSHSLPAVREEPSLAVLAREHSGDLARRRPTRVDHQGLRKRFERASGTLTLVSFAENVARMGRKRPDPATWVVEGWAASAAHRKNIEGDYDLMGVGVFRREDGDYFFTQIFAGTPPQTAASR